MDRLLDLIEYTFLREARCTVNLCNPTDEAAAARGEWVVGVGAGGVEAEAWGMTWISVH